MNCRKHDALMNISEDAAGCDNLSYVSAWRCLGVVVFYTFEFSIFESLLLANMTTDAKIKNRHHKDAKRDDVVGTKREKSNANHTEDGQKTTHTTPASSRTMTVSMWKSAASDALSRANGQTSTCS